MAEQDLILRMRVVDGHVAAAEVESVDRALQKTEHSARRTHEATGLLSRGFGGLRTIIRSVTGIVGLAGIGLGIGELIKNAEGFQSMTAQLGASIRANIVHPTDEMRNKLVEFAEQFATKGGFAPPEEIKAMTTLMRINHSVARTIDQVRLATNIARGAHLGMAQATRVVAMAEMGRTTGLTRLGIALPKHVSALQALMILQKRYGGSTVAYNKTAAGAMTNFEHAIDIVGEKIGLLLTPALAKAFTWLAGVIDKAEKGEGIFRYLGIGIKIVAGYFKWWYGDILIPFIRGFGRVIDMAIKGNPYLRALAVGVGVVVAAFIAWEVISAVLTATLGALAAIGAVVLSPIFLISAAVAALIAGLTLAYEKVGWFRKAVNHIWDFLKGAPQWVSNAFKNVTRAIIAGINWVIGAIDKLIQAYNDLPFTPNIGRIDKIGDPFATHPHRDMAPALTLKTARRLGGGTITPAGADFAPTTITPRGADMAPSLTPKGADMAPHVAQGVRDGLNGAMIVMDGAQVGRLQLRQAQLQKARQ